jgi:hypothetical protein
LLDTHGKIADRGGNSWTAWRKITPQHNELVEAMLQSTSHIIATMRSKMEYAQSEENGKKTVKKIGLAPVQREGMEYEFTVFFDIDVNHVSTASKDRTSLFDGKYFTPSPETGTTLVNWLNNAPDALPVPAPAQAAKATAAPAAQPADAPKDKAAAKPNRYAEMYARITTIKLPEENYKKYVYQRYSIDTLQKLTDEQIAEQMKLLTSLNNPARLKQFQDILATVQ